MNNTSQKIINRKADNEINVHITWSGQVKLLLEFSDNFKGITYFWLSADHIDLRLKKEYNYVFQGYNRPAKGKGETDPVR